MKTDRKQTVAEIFKKKAGNVSATCSAAGISRDTFYRWRKEDPDFATAIKDVEESLIDMAETQLISQIGDGNMTAIIFYLKTKGKKRGYVERQELTGAEGKDLNDNRVPDLSNWTTEQLERYRDLLDEVAENEE